MMQIIKKYWQAIVFILIFTGVFIAIWVTVFTQPQRTATIYWKYDNPEPKMFFRAYEIIDWDRNLVSEDSLRVETYVPPPPPAITVKRLSGYIPKEMRTLKITIPRDGKWHYYIVTAVDSVGNESTPSDVGVIYMPILARPYDVEVR